MKLKFSAKGLSFLAHYKAKQDIRYYLNGIYLEPFKGGVIGCATDGHMAGMWFDKGGHVDRPIIIDTSSQLERAASARARNEELTIEVVDGRLCVMEGQLERYVQPGKTAEKKPIDNDCVMQRFELSGKFPEMRRVTSIRSGDQRGPTDPFAASLLNRLSASFQGTVGKKRGAGLHFHQEQASSSVLVTCGWLPEAAAIIMPMRDGDLPTQDWLRAFAAPKRPDHVTV